MLVAKTSKSKHKPSHNWSIFSNLKERQEDIFANNMKTTQIHANGMIKKIINKKKSFHMLPFSKSKHHVVHIQQVLKFRRVQVSSRRWRMTFDIQTSTGRISNSWLIFCSLDPTSSPYDCNFRQNNHTTKAGKTKNICRKYSIHSYQLGHAIHNPRP